MEGHSKEVTAITMTPNGQQIISGSQDGTLKVWDLKSGHLLRSLDCRDISALAITPDGRKVICACGKILKILDQPSGRVLHLLEGHSDRVQSVAVFPYTQQIVSGSKDGTLKVWDLKSGRLLLSMEGHTKGITSVAVTPDGRQVVSVSDDIDSQIMGLGEQT